jgi:exodeoxyribonuclease V alpha subunit
MADILIKGVVRVVVVKFLKNGFGILMVTPVLMEQNDTYSSPTVDKYNIFTIKGNVPDAEVGETFNLQAKEINDPNWGLQYTVMFMNSDVELSTQEDQKIFLSRICTPKQLDALYEAFENPLEVIKNEEIEKLTSIKGLGVTLALKLISKYKATIDYSCAYVELNSLGITDKMIKKLCDVYKSPDILVQKYKENPYIICGVDGIGFKKADDYALKYGVAPDAPERIIAYINYYLETEAQRGNSWVHSKHLIEAFEKDCGVIDRKVTGLCALSMKNLWWSPDKKRVGLMKYRILEQKIAEELMRLHTAPNTFSYPNWEEIITQTEKSVGFEYTDEQKDGVKLVLDNCVSCVTGLGGTGKTTVTKAMVQILNTYHFAQCALSGKASQRMFEVTGYEGFTIHRLLGYELGQFAYNKYNQLPYDIIILDETSMLGGELFLDLIEAIPTGSKLIILGDSGQLSSIGACNVFHDLLTNGTIPCVKLTKIHRQAQKSAIITESINVRKQRELFPRNYVGKKILGELQDLEFDIYKDNTESAKRILMQFKEKLPTVESILDIQVLVAQKTRGDICTYRLNNAIQKMYNPDGENEIELAISKEMKYKVSEGDKVINTVNNYQTISISGKIIPVYNGNIGIVERINKEDELMVINFEGIGRLLITKENWSSIQLGYAITTHKYQGSQAHTVIIGLDYSAFMSLSCEWLYTAITRASKYCVLVGENKAIAYAITQTKTPIKQTFLCEILQSLQEKECQNLHV